MTEELEVRERYMKLLVLRKYWMLGNKKQIKKKYCLKNTGFLGYVEHVLAPYLIRTMRNKNYGSGNIKPRSLKSNINRKEASYDFSFLYTITPLEWQTMRKTELRLLEIKAENAPLLADTTEKKNKKRKKQVKKKKQIKSKKQAKNKKKKPVKKKKKKLVKKKKKKFGESDDSDDDESWNYDDRIINSSDDSDIIILTGLAGKQEMIVLSADDGIVRSSMIVLSSDDGLVRSSDDTDTECINDNENHYTSDNSSKGYDPLPLVKDQPVNNMHLSPGDVHQNVRSSDDISTENMVEEDDKKQLPSQQMLNASVSNIQESSVVQKQKKTSVVQLQDVDVLQIVRSSDELDSTKQHSKLSLIANKHLYAAKNEVRYMKKLNKMKVANMSCLKRSFSESMLYNKRDREKYECMIAPLFKKRHVSPQLGEHRMVVGKEYSYENFGKLKNENKRLNNELQFFKLAAMNRESKKKHL